MHHGAFFASECGEGTGFDIPVIARTLVPPFHCHEGFLETIERSGGAVKGKRTGDVFGTVDLLGFSG